MMLRLLLLLGGVSSLVAAQDKGEDLTANGNEIIDGLLREARDSDSIQKKINPVIVKHVELDDRRGHVENISIYGLSSLARHGDVNITFSEANLVIITGRLRADDLNMSGRYLYRPSRFFRLRGSLGATLNYFVVEIGMEVNTELNRASVTTFKVVELGKIKVTKFTGASFAFNWLGKFIINKILNGRSFSISERLEISGKKALNRLLEEKEIRFK
ncbi:uncharacterized protein LOC119405224 [Rhipicephalus sanguineus]|uniref:Uncharacterized protein n=1 Tax=Rhipicephalus sanguineus TaxID=34632 RepID=A0A9D4T981_RHISA|nr:uncharacterized protein LOC119405224 [Rhipicephalus sanguineus]KAH7983168.1 hypothetical protein HPB52_009706 [Rhipicephalus sanguineus]